MSNLILSQFYLNGLFKQSPCQSLFTTTDTGNVNRFLVLKTVRSPYSESFYYLFSCDSNYLTHFIITVSGRICSIIVIDVNSPLETRIVDPSSLIFIIKFYAIIVVKCDNSHIHNEASPLVLSFFA